MKLSAPIYRLKSQAKTLKKQLEIPLAEALDKIAQQEGFTSWSLLISKQQDLLPNNFTEMLEYLNNGDLLLVAARPKMGKTSFVTGLLAQAAELDHTTSYLFSLMEREDEFRTRLDAYLDDSNPQLNQCEIDCSDDINSDYIIETLRTRNIQPGALVVVDYLQLLDERRTSLPIQVQIEQLKAYAESTGCVIVFLSQVDRSVVDSMPGPSKVRLPNPLDLKLFNKKVFLNRSESRSGLTDVALVGNQEHRFSIMLDLKTKRFADVP